MNKKIIVAMIGTLPPLKGISPYCYHLVRALSMIPGLAIIFYNYKKLYPSMLYPGRNDKVSSWQVTTISNNVKVLNVLTYYNISTWIKIGLKSIADVFHLQWWADVYFLHYLLLIILLKLRRKPVIITAHNIVPHEPHFFSKVANFLVFLLSDKIIVHSHENKKTLLKMYPINYRKVYIIHHGILSPPLVDETNFNLTKEDAKRKLNIPLDKQVILFFGNIRYYKGLDTLLYAFKNVLSKYPNVLLVIAGKPWNNWKMYNEIISKLGLRRYVKLFLQYIPPEETHYFFIASDVVVLPYRNFFSQSGVGLYALYFNKPLIVSDQGGLPELVRDESVIVNSNDVESLSRVLIRVLTDTTLLKKLSMDSAILAKQYSWDKSAKLTFSLYKTVIGARK